MMDYLRKLEQVFGIIYNYPQQQYQNKSSEHSLVSMTKRYSSQNTIKTTSQKLDIKQMQKNVSNMRKEMQTILHMPRQQQKYHKSDLPNISQSKLFKYCQLSTPRRSNRINQTIDRILKWSAQRYKSLDYQQAKGQQSPKQAQNFTFDGNGNVKERKPQVLRNQLKIRNSLKKIRQEMNLNKSQLVSLQNSKKVIRREDIIHSLKEKEGEKGYQQNDQTTSNKLRRVHQELSIQKIRKKNSKNKRRHQQKFHNVLDLINRKIQQSPPNPNPKTKIQQTIQSEIHKITPEPKLNKSRTRSRYYSESHEQNLSGIEHGLMENKKYMSVVLDSNLKMLRKEEEINKEYGRRVEKLGAIGNRYVDLSKYVLIFDKDKYKFQKVRKNVRLNPIVNKNCKSSLEIRKEETIYSPWDLPEQQQEPDFDDSLKQTIEEGSSNL